MNNHTAKVLAAEAQRRTMTEREYRRALQYRTVDTSTLKGLQEAERLHQAGWKIIRSGLFIIQFERCGT